MAMLHVYKHLKTADEIKGRKERIEFLRANRNYTVDKLLALTYRDDVEFDLPDTPPPYKPSIFEEYGNLHQEIRKIERTFVKGSVPGWPRHKREAVFIQVLEYVDKDDSTLLIGMLAKKLPFKGIDKKLVQEALPELFA
jgi:hypothetical protein